MSDVAISNWPAVPVLCRRQRLMDLAARLSRTMVVARGLVRGGRRLDLTGLDDGVGVLCAQTLDLPPEETSAMLPILRGVLAELDLLAAALGNPGAGPQTPC